MPSPLHALVQSLEDNIAQAILGKKSAIRLALVALLAEGHLLIEDAPGVGKTSLSKALAFSLGCKFTRLQFTPDMLPSDILGGSVFLGRYFVEAALAHGHEVTLFNRGQHNPQLFPEAEKLRGDRDGGLDVLREGRWGAVVAASGYLPRVVRAWV